MSACVDVSITVSTIMVRSSYPSKEAQVYSHRWPQPAGQCALLFSQFIICSRCPPWLQPWHHTNIPFTTWWHTAHMLAHWWHLEGRSRMQVKSHSIKFYQKQKQQEIHLKWHVVMCPNSHGTSLGTSLNQRIFWYGIINISSWCNSFHLSQIQPLLLIGRLQLLQLMCSVVDVWFRQVMALQVLNLMTSLDTFHSSNRCSRSM